MRTSLIPVLIALLGCQIGCSGSDESDSDDASTCTEVEVANPPPGGLGVCEVPMFVVFGNDDNAFSGADGAGGLRFLIDLFADRTNPAGRGNAATYDGAPVHFSMYGETNYIAEWHQDSPSDVKRAWRAAYEAGHELGMHTHTHAHGGAFTADEWEAEIAPCLDWITREWVPSAISFEQCGIGVPPQEVIGFRTPFLEYNDALFDVLLAHGVRYDCSIEEGFGADEVPSDYRWPYQLDSGSPANPAVTAHPGLWELPVYAYVVPPDEACTQYGVAPGLRDALAQRSAYFDPTDGKITGLDYNLWIDLALTADEFYAVHAYTLDQRLAGSRAPFTLGLHTDLYHPLAWDSAAMTGSTAEERMQALTDVFEYALSKPDVRIVSGAELLAWLEDPTAL
jgi:hypothetical protein